MNSKALIGGALAGVVLFLLGYLFYGILFKDAMGSGPCMRSEEDLNIPLIFVGNIITGLFLGYIFSKMSGVSSFGSGAITGAVIGLLIAGGYDCIMYATTSIMSDFTAILMDMGLSAIMMGIAAGVCGWWLGRNAS